MSNENQESRDIRPVSGGLMNALSPKNSFIVGLVGGIMLLCTIGFFVLLVMVINGNLETGSGKVAGAQKNANTNTNAAAAVNSDNAVPQNVDFQLTDDDFSVGPKDAAVTIVEFTDLQCPYCSSFHETMNQLTAKYPNDVRWVMKFFPLDSIHPQARPAALAAECVADQEGNDGFWKFVDGVFTNQATIGPALFESQATAAGANLDKFKKCVSDGTLMDKVDADYQLGVESGVQGTPGSYLNGTPLGGAVPLAQLETQVKSVLGI